MHTAVEIVSTRVSTHIEINYIVNREALVCLHTNRCVYTQGSCVYSHYCESGFTDAFTVQETSVLPLFYCKYFVYVDLSKLSKVVFLFEFLLLIDVN